MSGILNRTVMWVTMRQLFVRSRMISAFFIALIPLGVIMIFNATQGEYSMATGRFLIGMYRDFVIGTILPLVAIVFGTTAFGAEVNDGTIVYLLVKPEARWRIILSKFVVSVLATILVMIPAIFLPWIPMNHAEMPIDVPVVILEAVAVGALIYGALFIAIGIASKRALVMGLLYIIIIEFVLSRQAAGVMSFSVRELTLTALARIGEGNRWIGPGTVTLETFYTMGPLFFFGSLFYAWNKFRKFEISEKL
jgi:ABC-2 type transport system permease protein